MTLQLEAPPDDDALLDLDAESLHLKPVMTGDVFVDIPLIGEEEPCTVMVAGHPCTIRQGVGLIPRVPCVRVSPAEWLAYKNWPRYDKNRFHLSEAAGLGGHAAVLYDWVPIAREALLRSRRRVTLQNYGIAVFQQRFTHSLTRFVVPIRALEESSRHVLDEAEIEMTWISELLPAGSDPDGPELQQLQQDFDAFLGEENRRAALRTDRRRITREVDTEIEHRLADPPQ